MNKWPSNEIFGDSIQIIVMIKGKLSRRGIVSIKDSDSNIA